jgi:DNA-directed RNA polymerase subunit RPC12/RpoP
VDLLCGGCGNTLAVDDGKAGQSIECPRCNHVIHVPGGDDDEGLLDPSRSSHPPGKEVADEFLTKARMVLKRKLLVQCGHCGERLTVSQRMSGKQARCPSCSKDIHIPSFQTDELPPRRAKDGAPEAQPAEQEAGEELEEVVVAAKDDLGDDVEPLLAVAVAAVSAATASTAAGATQAGPAGAAAATAGKPADLRQYLPVAIGAVAIALVLALIYHGGQHNTPPPSDEVSQAPLPKPDDHPAAIPTPTSAGTVTVANTANSVKPPVPAPPPPPPEANVANIKATDAVFLALAGDALVPAPLGKAYLQVKVFLTAGDAPATVDRADQVVLESVGGKTPALGVLAAEPSIIPAVAKPVHVSLAAGATKAFTFVFLVPVSFDGGTVKVAGMGESEVPTFTKTMPGAEALAGNFAESGRHLRLSLETPVMEDVRAAGKLQLNIRREEDKKTEAVRYLASLEPAGLRGEVKPGADGVFAVTFVNGDGKLDCGIRLVEERRLVLYLSGEPFHQVIFEKQGP